MASAFVQTEAHWARLFSRKALNGMLVGTIFALSLGISVYLASRAVQQDRMSLGDFVLVTAYMLQIVRPMEMSGFAFRDIAQAWHSSKRQRRALVKSHTARPHW